MFSVEPCDVEVISVEHWDAEGFSVQQRDADGRCGKTGLGRLRRKKSKNPGPEFAMFSVEHWDAEVIWPFKE